MLDTASVVALVPCRLDSSRLPKKALLDVSGKPAIVRLIDQVERSTYLSRRDIVVCTTSRASDDPLAEAVVSAGAKVFRGNTDDLIDRLYQASVAHPSDLIVQIDGDDLCPDMYYADLALDAVRSGKCDVAYSGPGLPLGAGTKAFKHSCLKRVYEAYIPGKNDTGFGYYLTKSDLFNVLSIDAPPLPPLASRIRITLDYEEDLELFRQIYNYSDKSSVPPSVEFILQLIESRPELAEINADLDEGYWERTRELINLHPLQLRINGKIRKVG